MRVLLIAPQTDLPMAQTEVQFVANQRGLDVRLMLGEVRRADVVREVQDGEYDVLWLATHGNETGVQLTDGIYPSSSLTQVARGRFDLVFLNSCKSWQTAQMLQNETGAEIIATIIDVPDAEAFQTGALFAAELARTGDVETAYNDSRPGANRTYIRLAGSKKK